MEEREIKEKAIVIKNEDSGEADRIITLLTLEHGKIRAKMKGVKKSKAKLAYASFPFNFGEYLLIKSGRNYTVTNCSYIDNFSGLTYDLNKYYAGAGVLEIAEKLSRESSDTYELFVAVLNALKSLCYDENVNIFTILSKYLVEVLEISGFKLNVEEKSGRYFDFVLGKLTSRQSEDVVLLDDVDSDALKHLILNEISSDEVVSKTILKLLILFFENKVDEELTILKKFI